MKNIMNILQQRYPNNSHAVEHFGNLLINYYKSELAPPHMISELETKNDGKFWSHIWEALLFDHLKLMGFEFVNDRVSQRGQIGPDFGIKYENKIIWFEAVAPEPEGIPKDYLEPILIGEFRAGTEPHEQKLLRWTSAVKSKKDKIAQYIREGIISENDCVVIAVNSCKLQNFAFNDIGISQFPYAVEATYPVGPLSISLNRSGRAIGSATNSIRHKVLNKNNADVPTDSFLNHEYNIVSAVIGAYQRDLCNRPLQISLVLQTGVHRKCFML